jgi:hypothetical protein
MIFNQRPLLLTIVTTKPVNQSTFSAAQTRHAWVTWHYTHHEDAEHAVALDCHSLQQHNQPDYARTAHSHALHSQQHKLHVVELGCDAHTRKQRQQLIVSVTSTLADASQHKKLHA